MPASRTVIEGWDFDMPPAQVAAAFGVRVRTVTEWANKGLLATVRTPGGHRRYSRQQVEALLRGDGENGGAL